MKARNKPVRRRAAPAKARRSSTQESSEGTTPSFYEAVWALVRRIPRGKVATYGQVATWLGSPRAARAVGYAMFNAPDDRGRQAVPWHRVINARGEISIGGAPWRPDLQRRLLRREGIRLSRVNDVERVDLRRYGWKGPRTMVDAVPPRGRRRR